MVEVLPGKGIFYTFYIKFYSLIFIIPKSFR